MWHQAGSLRGVVNPPSGIGTKPALDRLTTGAVWQHSRNRTEWGFPSHWASFARGRVDNPMPLSSPVTGHLHKLWGGRPRPQPAPWPAFRPREGFDPTTGQRVQGDPRGPGGPPHQDLPQFGSWKTE